MHQNPGDHLDREIAEDSKMQAQWRKIVFMPTQHYNTPSGKVGKRFVGIISLELDGVCDKKWNIERVIFFNPLSYNTHKALIIMRKFSSAYCFNSIDGIVGHLTNS